MNQLHFFPVRSVKAMRREQRGTVSVRLFNTFNAFNAFKNFPEPNRARRMRIPARFYGVLLAGMFGLVLTGCGGGGSGGGGDPAAQNSPAVSNIQTLVGEDYILVGWTNPASDNITGFVITARRDNASDGGTTELNSTVADVAPLARVIYNITGLTNDITYHITIAVRYKSRTIGTSPPVSSTTGAGAGVGTDIDDDDTVNGADAFRTDACASTDTDNDGNPDSLVPGCTTSPLTEDMDDDGDGEDDDNDLDFGKKFLDF